MNFFIGLHQPADAHHFERCMISVKRLAFLQTGFVVREWMMDSGAFTEITTHGRYRSSPEDYAGKIVRWTSVGRLAAAVSQDWMCESFVLKRTGLTVPEHQRLTIERYDRIVASVWGLAYVMPVLQGYAPAEYVSHVRQYGSRLAPAAWVGFGVKTTALQLPEVRDLLESADSMAWSLAGRRQGKGTANDYREAQRFLRRIEAITSHP